MGNDRPTYGRSLGARLPGLVVLGPAIFILAVVLSGAGYLWLKSLPTSYSSESSVILLVDQGTKENPYTYFPKSVILTGQIVATRLSQEPVRTEILAAGGVHDYTILVQNEGNQWVPIYTQPTVSISAVSTDSDALARTQTMLLERIRSQLQDLQVQAGVPPAIKVQVLADGDPYVLHGRPTKAMGMILILSLWSSALFVRAIRRGQLRRRSQRLQVPDRSALDREVQLVGS